MSRSTHEAYDLAVIGAGPGGYVAALRAAQLGLRTALIERERIGGVCLNWGCIPTKALLRSAHLYREIQTARTYGLAVEGLTADYAAVVRRSRQSVERLVKGVEFLLRRAGVIMHAGQACIAGRDGEQWRIAIEGEASQSVRAPRLLLATGARPRPLPGIAFDATGVLSSREALGLTEVPARLLIIGAGPIGMEFADLFQAFGAEVTLVEMMPQVLPGLDSEAAAELVRAFQRRKIRIHTGARVTQVVPGAQGLTCRVVPAGEGAAGTPGGAAEGVREAGEEVTVEVDRVLVAIGVTGNTEHLGLEQAGLAAERGFLAVDAHGATSAPGIYAIGDLVGAPLLAHAASAEGLHAVGHATGGDPAPLDPTWVPGVVYTEPQLASVGLGEDAARAHLARTGGELAIGRFPFRASGRAVAEGETRGFIKVLLERGSGRLLGAHLVGPSASELVAELGVLGRCGVTASALRGVVHAHPTLAEGIPEAFAAALGEGLHA